MREKEFMEIIQEELKKKLGEDVQITLRQVHKNNSVMYKGLIIRRAERNVAPTIYMEPFLEMFEEGESISVIVERVLQVYRNCELKEAIDMNFFLNFEQVKDRIVYRVVNQKRNEALLQDIPYIPFLDLAICFYYAFYSEEMGDGMIMIHNSHMDMWNTNHQQLFELARENTKRLFPPMVIMLDTIMKEMDRDMEDACLQEIPEIYVLTNHQKCQGAVTLLDAELLETMGKKLKGNYYIIPSSIHEVILLKDSGHEDGAALHDMIADTNSSQLLEEDILSDYPYYYNTSDKKLSQILCV